MTLNTSLIERESRGIYERYINNPSIPEDLCADIYLEFVKRMNLEREKGTKRVSGSFIGQIMKQSKGAVLHRNKEKKEEEELVNEIISGNASQFWCHYSEKDEKEFFMKIARFLKDWSGKTEKRARHLRVFLLYHAYYLSYDVVERLQTGTDVPARTLYDQIEEVQRTVGDKVNGELDKKMDRMGKQYSKEFRNQWGSGKIKPSRKHYEKAKEKSHQAYEDIRNIKFRPTWNDLERISGINAWNARNANLQVNKAIKESFKDDSYWGS